jgi:hypothetical protein
MSAGTRLSAGLLVEVEMTVLIVAAKILGELLALVYNLFYRIEFWKMSAYINLLRW